MAYRDFREWLRAVESQGDLLRVSGASHELEMAGIAEVLCRESREPPPALLFDLIPGFQSGYRTCFGMLASPARLASALRLPEGQHDRMSLVRNWRNKRRNLKPLPPNMVHSGPVLENVLTGRDIDLLKFPVPRFHQFDGGPYFGTAHGVITRDPDTGWVNVGCYRNMLVERDRLALHMTSGKDAEVMRHKYHAKKEAMPVAIATGIDPCLWLNSFTAMPYGLSEYDVAGGIIGEPMELVKAPYTSLPVPAGAEIVVEGEIQPGDMTDEGPFGEWNGYYCNRGLESVPEPVIRVKTVMHRNDPILTCCSGGKLPHDYSLALCLGKAGMIWDSLEGAGVPGVAGVWCPECGGGHLLTVVSLKTGYAGHSRQAALIASQSGANVGRYTIVVDEDVDPSDLDQVVWAVCTRTDPERAIEILRYCRSSNADPAVPIELKRKLGPRGAYFMSRAIIDACRPFEWKQDFYPIAEISSDLRSSLLTKWSQVFEGRL